MKKVSGINNIFFIAGRFYITLLLLLSISPYLYSATGTGRNGNWNQNATWNFAGINRIPACGDTLIIPANVTITVNSQEDYSICSQPMVIEVDGILEFANGNKLTLPCTSSVYLLPNGKVKKSGAGGGNSSYIHICNCVAWQASDGQVAGPGNLNCSVLPVSLLNFNATQKENIIELAWSTATELNNDFFSIERSTSTNDFKSIGIIKGNGNSTSRIDYTFEDHDQVSGIVYYRLRQVDYDGTSSYSDIVAVKTKSDKKLNLITTVANDGSVSFQIHNTNYEVAISIYTINGQKVFSKNINTESVETRFTIPVSLSKGDYLIFSSNGIEQVNSKFTVN